MDLAAFTLTDMSECAATLRKIGRGAQRLESVAQRVVRHLHQSLGEGTSGRPATALVRFYKTHRFGRLAPPLQAFARQQLGDADARPELPCLVLLATAGVKPSWNVRAESAGHLAIPLPGPTVVAKAPMIANLISQLGLQVETVLNPDPQLLLDRARQSYNVFHVPDAAQSPYIPAQADFVRPYGVRSVVGFGGLLPSGSLFSVILFSRVRVSRETADLFRSLAATVKVAILPFDDPDALLGLEEPAP